MYFFLKSHLSDRVGRKKNPASPLMRQHPLREERKKDPSLVDSFFFLGLVDELTHSFRRRCPADDRSWKTITRVRYIKMEEEDRRRAQHLTMGRKTQETAAAVPYRSFFFLSGGSGTNSECVCLNCPRSGHETSITSARTRIKVTNRNGEKRRDKNKRDKIEIEKAIWDSLNDWQLFKKENFFKVPLRNSFLSRTPTDPEIERD